MPLNSQRNVTPSPDFSLGSLTDFLPSSIKQGSGLGQQNIQLYYELLDDEKVLYKRLYRFFYAAEIIEQTTPMKITRNGRETEIPVTMPILKRLPDESKICKVCEEFRMPNEKGETWDYCTRDKKQTLWYRWHPLLNDVGINTVVNSILAKTNPNISTSNLPAYFNIEEVAMNSAFNLANAILENESDWINEGSIISRGLRFDINMTLTINFYAILTRGKEGKMLDVMGKNYNVNESVSRQENQSQGGGKGNWLSSFTGNK